MKQSSLWLGLAPLCNENNPAGRARVSTSKTRRARETAGGSNPPSNVPNSNDTRGAIWRPARPPSSFERVTHRSTYGTTTIKRHTAHTTPHLPALPLRAPTGQMLMSWSTRAITIDAALTGTLERTASIEYLSLLARFTHGASVFWA